MRIALLLAVACATPAPMPARNVYAVPSRAMAPAPHCETAAIEPSLTCGGRLALKYDGCRWACRPWFEPELLPRQETTYTVNGYPVPALR